MPARPLARTDSFSAALMSTLLASESGSARTIGVPASPVPAPSGRAGPGRADGTSAPTALGQPIGDRLPAAGLPNTSMRVPSGSFEPGHVLDDAGDPLSGLQCDRPGAFGDLRGRLLRCRDDQDLGVRNQLCDRDRDVAGAGRQVEQQDVEVAPEDVGEELLQRAVQHRSAPYHGRVALGELRDRDHLHVVRDRRHDHPLDLGGPGVRAEHAGDGMAVDVGVHTPTDRPRAAIAAARLTVTLDFPTPPLPDATAVDPGE